MKREKVHDYSIISIILSTIYHFLKFRRKKWRIEPCFWAFEDEGYSQVKMPATEKKIRSKKIDAISNEILEKQS